MTRPAPRHGFTLVEMSVVLVVVGLVAAGVLGGRELIESYRITAQARQIDQFDAAVNTFKIKYGYLPGDIPFAKASQFGLPPGWYGWWDANGDGMYNSGFMPVSFGYTATYEQVLFWPQLAAARLVEGSYAVSTSTGAFARMKLNPQYGIMPMTMPTLGEGNWWALGATHINWSIRWSDSSTPVVAPSLTPQQALQLDQRMDDGKPGSGRVRAVQVINTAVCNDPGGAGCFVVDTNANASFGIPNCVVNGGATYNLTQTGVNCILAIKMQ